MSRILKPPQAKFHLICREDTSDYVSYKQVFEKLQYLPLDGICPEFVIDCGAYVGYSSAYFLSAFPEAFVVALEPYTANFDSLQQNLRHYGNRVKCLNAAVWSHQTKMSLIDDKRYRGGREWSKQFREDSEGNVDAFSIDQILDEYGSGRISLLKLDIEGAEAVVFKNCQNWIDKVDVIAIELHTDTIFGDGKEEFYEACKGKFEIEQFDELTIAKSN